MNYDDWKLMTPEEDAGLTSSCYTVNVHVFATQGSFRKDWKDYPDISNVTNVIEDWDGDNTEDDVEFDIKLDIEILTSGSDDDIDIYDKIHDAVISELKSIGNYEDYDILNYKW